MRVSEVQLVKLPWFRASEVMDNQRDLEQAALQAAENQARELVETRRQEFERFVQWKMEIPMNLVFSEQGTMENPNSRVRLFSVQTINDHFYADDVISVVINRGDEIHYEVQEFFDYNGTNFGQILFWENPNYVINGRTGSYAVKLVLIVEAFFDTEITTDFALCVEMIA